MAICAEDGEAKTMNDKDFITSIVIGTALSEQKHEEELRILSRQTQYRAPRNAFEAKVMLITYAVIIIGLIIFFIWVS